MRLFVLLVMVAGLIGCAAPQKPVSTAQAPSWSGRLSIKIDETQAQPSLQISAGFTLVGQPTAGQLELFSPLGSMAAQVVWGIGFATMSDGKVTKQFADVETALESVTNVKIPLSYLFDWLQGKQNKALEASIGWEADLSRFAEGRLIATRLQPLPRTELRIILEP